MPDVIMNDIQIHKKALMPGFQPPAITLFESL